MLAIKVLIGRSNAVTNRGRSEETRMILYTVLEIEPRRAI